MHFQQLLFKNYDLDSDVPLYARFRGPYQGHGALSTSGSSATITAANAGAAPLGVGDVLWIRQTETLYERTVATWTSAVSFTVDTVIDLSTATPSWEYLKFEAGVEDSDGWVPTRNTETPIVQVSVFTAGGVKLTIQTRDPLTQTPVTLHERTYEAMTSGDDAKVDVISLADLGVLGPVRVGFSSLDTGGGEDIITASLHSTRRL